MDANDDENNNPTTKRPCETRRSNNSETGWLVGLVGWLGSWLVGRLAGCWVDDRNKNDQEDNSTTTHTTYEIANDTPAYYMPYNPHCLLTNIYGYDYMTPKSGPTSQAKYGGEHGRPAYGNPQCNSTLSMLEQDELERQLKFCNSSEIRGIPERTLDIVE